LVLFPLVLYCLIYFIAFLSFNSNSVLDYFYSIKLTNTA
jgi:hypothetical protein